MTPAEFSKMLCEWRARSAWSDSRAAMELGIPYGTLRHWLMGRMVPNYFAQCAAVRQMREGRDPLCRVRMTPTEFARLLKDWRAKHRFTQRQAGVALGTTADVVRGWESKDGMPRQPALGEILRRLRMPVDEELVKQATKRPPLIEPQKFAELLRAWRRRRKLSREAAARELRSTGLRTIGRTVWTWESGRALPWRPQAILDLIHGPLAVTPPNPRGRKPNLPRPLMTPKQFAKALRDWRRTHCLTQRQACVALGLPHDQALISDWERGKAFPRKPRLQQLVAALKQPPASGPGTHNWFTARSKEFGQKLRAWRKARCLRQMDACALLGLPRDQGLICRYECGEASPRRERMTRILAIICGTEVQP